MRSIRWAVFLVAGCLAAYGQSNQATISGTITDMQGAAVPAATVVATDMNTGVKTSTISDTSGFYSIPNLPIGAYSLAVERQGFQRYDHSGIVLSTGQTLGLDIHVAIGSVTQTVNVTGAPPMTETRTSDISQLIESKSIQDIPLGNRQTMNIINLVAGAVFLGYDVNDKPTFSLSGGRTQNQMFWIDGGDGQNIRLGIGQMDMDPPIETVSEIKVISNNYSAAYGGSPGGVVLETTKSGTNEFHGAGYEYLRNNVFDAPGYFAPVQNGAKQMPELRYNVFGATLGGPIKHNKTFFFGGYQGQRQVTGAPNTLTVPTSLQRSGDFSRTLNAAGAVIPIYDPATTATVNGKTTRKSFPGNVIPASRFDQVALKVLQYYPLPNKPPSNLAGANNFSGNYNTIFDNDFVIVKVDHAFNDKNKLTGRYLYNRGNPTTTSVFPDPAADPHTSGVQHEHNFFGDYTRILTAAAVNDLRFSYDYRFYHLIPHGLDQGYASKLGLPGLADTAFPQFVASGFANLGAPTQERQQFPIDQYQVVDDFSWVHGKHSMEFGFEARRSRDHETTLTSPSGAFTFSTLTTGQPGNAATGFSLASLLLGIPNAFTQVQTAIVNRTTWYYAVFAQDDWTVTPNLTLNLGLRWDTDTPMVDSNNRLNGFDPTQINPVSGTPGVVKFMGVNGWRTNAWSGDWNNLGPRFGFSWMPFGSPATVVRGGFGVFYTEPFDTGDPASATLGFGTSVTVNSPDNGLSFPFTLQTFTPQTGPMPVLNDSFGAVKVGQNPNTAVTYFDVNRGTGYAYQFNLGVQRQLSQTIVAEVTFLANNGRKLPNTTIPINQIAPNILSPTTDTQAYRPFPQFSNVSIVAPTNGTSYYYAGTARVEKRFSGGLNFTGSYTWSKFLDDTFEGSTTAGLNNGPYSNLYNRRADYGYSANDIAHRFSLSSVYELPFGQGKRWGGSGVPSYIVGGWSLSGVATVQSGPPATAITQTNNTNAFSAGSQRPNLLRNPDLSHRTIEEWFDTSAFAQPAFFTFGSEGVGIIRTPGLVNFDFALLRTFPIHESIRLQMRGEFFNAFNHTNLGLPASTFGAPGFGVISSAGSARQIEIGARVSF